MRGSISQKDKNVEKRRKRGVVCLTKSAQPEPILVCFKFSIFTLVYGFTYSYWYRSDRWPTHPWVLANIHNKCVNRVKHFLANTHTLLLAYTLFKVACIISAFFFRPVLDPPARRMSVADERCCTSGKMAVASLSDGSQPAAGQ